MNHDSIWKILHKHAVREKPSDDILPDGETYNNHNNYKDNDNDNIENHE